MANDKLNDLTPTDVEFEEGERPTHIKLGGAINQIEAGLDFLEYTIGDAFGTGGNFPTNWVNNLSRDLGDRDKLSPQFEPGVLIPSYVQTLVAGKNDHELDLIPTGVGIAIVASSTDSSVVPSQYKATIADLDTIGDWTIAAGLDEEGVTKNDKRLVTFAPSTGGTVTFTEVTTGHGDAYAGATWNVIPTVAQALEEGDFCEIEVLDAINNIYLITLPDHTHSYNRLGETSTKSLSNTATYNPTRQYRLPDYFFDPAGLDLATNDILTSLGKIYPLGLVRIYDWDAKQLVSGLLEVKAADVAGDRPYQLICTFENGIVLDDDPETGHYMVVSSATTFAQLLDKLRNEVYNHTHAGDDLIRHLKHSDLLNLRTVDSFATVSDWYGASNISNNDHSHSLHRDGFDISDVGGGYNLMRGNILIGSSAVAGTVPHYNITSDSYSLQFGTNAGPAMYFDFQRTHNIANGYTGVPASFNLESLVISGANSSGTLTTYVDGTLRVSSHVVLGTSTTDEVVVPGKAFIQNYQGLKELGASPTAVASHGLLYAKNNTDGDLFYKNSAGTEFNISRGHVPIGGVIPIIDAAGFTVPASGLASVEGWQRTDGAAYAAGSILIGNTPIISDSRFIMGATTGGTTGGSNSSAHTHVIAAHFHSGTTGGQSASHTHQVTVTNLTNAGNDADGGTDQGLNNSGVFTTTGPSSDHNHAFTTTGGAVNGGSDMTSGAASVTENRPQYISGIYLIRVR